MTRIRRVFFVVTAIIGVLALWLWWPNELKLFSYAARGDVAGVRLCLRFGVNPNAPERWGWYHENDGRTPLTVAARYGSVEVVRILLKNGADPNLRDSGPNYPQQTPVAAAAIGGQLEVCQVLLENGADPNMPTNPKQAGAPGNWTALDWALQADQKEVAEFLRQHGGRESGRRHGKAGFEESRL